MTINLFKSDFRQFLSVAISIVLTNELCSYAWQKKN